VRYILVISALFLSSCFSFQGITIPTGVTTFKSFQAFQDFNASENLQDLEEELIEVIFDDITERIFNDTFSDW